MNADKPAVRVERSLSASVKDVAAYGLMLGLGEAFLGAYFVYLGAVPRMIGVLSTLPQLAGSLFQVWSANAVERTLKRRRIYLMGAVLQTLMWLPIVATVFLPTPLAIWVLLAALLFYFGGLHFATPAWNSAMGDLVPAERRGAFFGLRNRVNVALTLAGMTFAGVALHELKARGYEAWTFAGLFGLAFLARAASTLFLSRMDEPPYATSPDAAFTFLDFVKRLRVSNFAKFAFMVAALSFAVNVAGPFFALYMFKNLGFSYTEFMVGQNVILLTQIVAFPYWGRLADRYGNRRVMALSLIGVTVVPGLWTIAQSAPAVYAIQALAGFAWSGFNLASGNFILDAVSPPKRARCTAYYNVLCAIGVAAGGVIGGYGIDYLPTTIGPIVYASRLQTIMLVSCALRALVAVVAIPLIREVREVPTVGPLGFIYRATFAKSAVDALSDLVTEYRRKE